MSEKMDLLVTALAEKKASGKNEFAEMISDIGKATTLAALKPILIRLVNLLAK